MKHEEIKEWFDTHFEAKMAEFGVPHWRITIEYDEELGNLEAQITSRPEYERATIKIKPSAYYSHPLEALIDTVEHELMHIAHSPFNYYGGLVDQFLTPEQIKATNVIWSDSCEMTVRNLERLVFSIRRATKEKTESDANKMFLEKLLVEFPSLPDDVLERLGLWRERPGL